MKVCKALKAEFILVFPRNFLSNIIIFLEAILKFGKINMLFLPLICLCVAEPNNRLNEEMLRKLEMTAGNKHRLV
jgi:hypothetical protein